MDWSISGLGLGLSLVLVLDFGGDGRMRGDQKDMKAERANATAKESLNAVCWFSAARMRDVLARSLSLSVETRSIPLRAASWGCCC
jgi:hypothetical protein